MFFLSFLVFLIFYYIMNVFSIFLLHNIWFQFFHLKFFYYYRAVPAFYSFL